MAYSTLGDGGGGQFYWDAGSTSADSAGTIIAPTGISTGRWIRQYSGEVVDARWFGVRADGANTGNPTFTVTGTDDTAAWQRAIDACGTKVHLRMPSSGYSIVTSPLLVRTGTTSFEISGPHRHGVYQEQPSGFWTKGITGYLIDPSAAQSSGGALSKFALGGFSVSGSNGAVADYPAQYSTTFQGIFKPIVSGSANLQPGLRLRDMTIKHVGSPTPGVIDLQNVFSWTLENVSLIEISRGRAIRCDGFGATSTTGQFVNVFVHGALEALYSRTSVLDLTLERCVFESCLVAAAVYDNQITFSNCYEENCGGGTSIAATKTFTANSTTDTFTSAAHGLVNDETIKVVNSGGALPAGLDTTLQYWVVNVTTNTFQLSLTRGGAAVDITTNGTGTNSVKTGITPMTLQSFDLNGIAKPVDAVWTFRHGSNTFSECEFTYLNASAVLPYRVRGIGLGQTYGALGNATFKNCSRAGLFSETFIAPDSAPATRGGFAFNVYDPESLIIDGTQAPPLPMGKGVVKSYADARRVSRGRVMLPCAVSRAVCIDVEWNALSGFGLFTYGVGFDSDRRVAPADTPWAGAHVVGDRARATDLTYTSPLEYTCVAASPAPTTITSATMATPIVIGFATAHGLTTGAVANISGGLGNTAMNGSWSVTFVDATHVFLNGSVGNGVYSASSAVMTLAGSWAGHVSASVGEIAGIGAASWRTNGSVPVVLPGQIRGGAEPAADLRCTISI